MLYPRNCIIRNLPPLTRSRQLSQCGVQSELKKLAGTQRDRVAIHPIAAGSSSVAHTAGQIQKYPCVHYLPLLSAAAASQAFQSLFLISGKTYSSLRGEMA